MVIGVLALVATGCTWEDMPRFGWPSGITPQAERMRNLWSASCIAALAVGVLVWGLIFWSVIFHRKKDDEIPRQTKYNHAMEFPYTILPFVAVAVLFYFTATTQNYINDESDPPDVTVTAVAFQWNWQFRYDDETSPVTNEAPRTTGTSTEIPILVLPTDQVIRIEEESKDVIHSFWVPDLLFKRDVIPGLTNSFQFKLNEEGAFVGRCAELCGIYHSMMSFELRSVSPDDYETYVRVLGEQAGNGDAQAQALRAIGQEPHATTTKPYPTKRNAREPG